MKATAQKPCYTSRRKNTNRRNMRIKARVDELCKLTIEGMRPHYDDVISKVAEEYGLSVSWMHRILKAV